MRHLRFFMCSFLLTMVSVCIPPFTFAQTKTTPSIIRVYQDTSKTKSSTYDVLSDEFIFDSSGRLLSHKLLNWGKYIDVYTYAPINNNDTMMRLTKYADGRICNLKKDYGYKNRQPLVSAKYYTSEYIFSELIYGYDRIKKLQRDSLVPIDTLPGSFYRDNFRWIEDSIKLRQRAITTLNKEGHILNDSIIEYYPRTCTTGEYEAMTISYTDNNQIKSLHIRYHYSKKSRTIRFEYDSKGRLYKYSVQYIYRSWPDENYIIIY